MALAGRAGTVADVDQAFAALDQLVTVAIEVQTRGQAGSNVGDFVDAVLAPHRRALRREPRRARPPPRSTAPSPNGRSAGGSRPRRASPSSTPASAPTSSRRDAPAAAQPHRAQARRSKRPTPPACSPRCGREQDAWYARGRDKGLSFDLEVSIALARTEVTRGRATRMIAAPP